MRGDETAPAVTVKLDYLAQCLALGRHEDAAGHLCDLLEYCRERIRPDLGPGFGDLVAMVKYYGVDPTPVGEDQNKMTKST